ncbi:PAH-inducible cytochrome P450 monooxygenase PC-PAH 1 [Trametes meyenii]|nr:PAH-inducible cytochrome P450 monooxygenase PC-PAH 1 [Trametes meyenii]
MTPYSLDATLLLILVAGVLLQQTVRRYLAGAALRKIQGPPSPSWMVGHIDLVQRQMEAGVLQKQWLDKYGTVWRTKGCLNEDALDIADPKALQYIFHKSGYHFPKTAVARQITREISGSGLLFAADRDHARIRKVMNPAFAPGHLKSFLPLFRSSAKKLGQKWEELLRDSADNAQRVDVLSWLARCTLDIIGEVGFDIQCGALDDSLHPVVRAYKNMFLDAFGFPSKTNVLFRDLWRYVPMPILDYVQYLPTKDHTRFRQTLGAVNKFAEDLIEEKTEAILAGGSENKRDIMSILVKANVSEDPKSRLTGQEMISQMANFFLAGHESTAYSISWMLYELARHPKYQTKLRDEVKAIRAQVAERGDSDFSVSDLDAMTYVLATMKEVLRLHPVVYMLVREAGRDDVLPLANPVRTVTGEIVDKIPIPKGTTCNIAIWAYNRLPQIWGPDADEFNPRRWMDNEKMGQTYVGTMSNLMTFSAGQQACIGWRFAIIEMQTILADLIERFEFSIPEDKPDIISFPAGIIVPLVKSDMQAGAQMPLRVSFVE